VSVVRMHRLAILFWQVSLFFSILRHLNTPATVLMTVIDSIMLVVCLVGAAMSVVLMATDKLTEGEPCKPSN
jgi:hypothetical protein